MNGATENERNETLEPGTNGEHPNRLDTRAGVIAAVIGLIIIGAIIYGARALPCAMDREIAYYKRERAEIIADMLTAIGQSDELVGQAMNNPDLFHDAGWVAEVTIWLKASQLIGAGVEDLVVPPRLAESHTHLRLATIYLYDFAADAMTAISRLDNAFLGRAMAHSEKAATAMGRSDHALRAVCG